MAKFLAGLSLLIGLTAMFMAGSLNSGRFSTALKAEFNYTNTSVKAIGIVRLLGTSITLPAGLTCVQLGAMRMGIISLVLSTVGCLLVWSCTMATQFFSGNMSLLFGIFSLIAAHGSTYLYMGALNCGLKSVDPSKKGLTIGVMNGAYVLSPALFSLLFLWFFNTSSSVWNFETDNLSGYLILITVGFVVVNVFAVFALRDYPPQVATDMTSVPTYPDVRAIVHSAIEYPETNEDLITYLTDQQTPVVGTLPSVRLSVQSASGSAVSSDTERLLSRYGIKLNGTGTAVIVFSTAQLSSTTTPGESTTAQLLKRREFLWLTAAFACGLSAVASVVSNLEPMLNSPNLNVVGGVFICATISSAVGTGWLSDRFSSRINRLTYVLPSSIGFFVSCVFCAALLSADNSAILLAMVSLFSGFSIGSLFCLVPTVLVDWYGVERFPILWGFVMSVSLVMFLVQIEIFDAIVDASSYHLALILPSASIFASILLTGGAAYLAA